jgi:hypothetical protein
VIRKRQIVSAPKHFWKAEANDLVVIESAEAAVAFKRAIVTRYDERRDSTALSGRFS